MTGGCATPTLITQLYIGKNYYMNVILNIPLDTVQVNWYLCRREHVISTSLILTVYLQPTLLY